MEKQNPQCSKVILDQNGDENSYKIGKSLALYNKPPDEMLIPFSRIFCTSSHLSFNMGLTLRYQKELEIEKNTLVHVQLKVVRRMWGLNELGEKEKIQVKGSEPLKKTFRLQQGVCYKPFPQSGKYKTLPDCLFYP